MRVIIVFVLLTFVSCENSKKINKNEVETHYSIEQQITQKKSNEELSIFFPIEENILDELDYIFDYGFEFDDGIIIEKIGLIEIKKNIYKTVFVLGDDVNFKKIQELVFGMIYYPSNSTLLELEAERKRGFIKTAVQTKIKKMGNSYVFIHDAFKIIPNNHKTIRFYFYNKDKEIVGDDLKLYNISFTQVGYQ